MELRKCECGGDVELYQPDSAYSQMYCNNCGKETARYMTEMQATQAWNEGKVE